MWQSKVRVARSKRRSIWEWIILEWKLYRIFRRRLFLNVTWLRAIGNDSLRWDGSTNQSRRLSDFDSCNIPIVTCFQRVLPNRLLRSKHRWHHDQSRWDNTGLNRLLLRSGSLQLESDLRYYRCDSRRSDSSLAWLFWRRWHFHQHLATWVRRCWTVRLPDLLSDWQFAEYEELHWLYSDRWASKRCQHHGLGWAWVDR